MVRSAGKFSAKWLFWYLMPIFAMALGGIQALTLASYPPENLGGEIGAMVGVYFLIGFAAVSAIIITLVILVKMFAPSKARTSD